MDGDYLFECTGLDEYPTDNAFSRYWEARRQMPTVCNIRESPDPNQPLSPTSLFNPGPYVTKLYCNLRYATGEIHCRVLIFHPNAPQSIVAAVAEWYRYRIVACRVTRSSPVPLKTRRVGQRCTLNLSRAETSSRWCGVVVRRGVPVQVSSTSLDHGSKLRGPSPKALV
ncbi:uncharacterized protein TNCV_4528811 [Trichonephila clavipes]|nr:uncharacterized protein TNCV_4528811 [Trichonephila clavipes]